MLGQTYAKPKRASSVFTIRVKNQGPAIIGSISDKSISIGTFFFLKITASKLFKDIDGDALTLISTLSDGSPLPSWLRFYPDNATFVGTPNNVEVFSINITALDPYLSNTTINFKLTVLDKPPITVRSIPDLCIYLDDPLASAQLTSILPGFASDQETYRLVYTLSSMSQGGILPNFLDFDPINQMISHNQAFSLFSGIWQMQLRATDGLGQSTITEFTLRIEALRP